MDRRKNLVIFLFAMVSWILYRATMASGYIPAISSVPFYFEISVFLVFMVISYIYFKKFNYTTPFQTAAIFVGMVVAGDFIVKAISTPSAFRFYVSLPQIWLRFAVIFLSVYLTGLFTTEVFLKAHEAENAGTAKHKFYLRTSVMVFSVILFFLAEISNTKGAHAELWIIPVIMAVVGMIGAVMGGMLGGSIGLIGKLFKKHILILSIQYGAAIGFMLLLAFWYSSCLRHGTAVCLPQ